MKLHNKLNNANTYRLLKWLDTPKRRVLCGILTDDEMAGNAANTLRVVITGLNIKGARKTLGILKHEPGEKRQINSMAAESLEIICQRLPASTLADMVAHIIGSDENGESEATSDFLYAAGKLRFSNPDWLRAIERAKARYDTHGRA